MQRTTRKTSFIDPQKSPEKKLKSKIAVRKHCRFRSDLKLPFSIMHKFCFWMPKQEEVHLLFVDDDKEFKRKVTVLFERCRKSLSRSARNHHMTSHKLPNNPSGQSDQDQQTDTFAGRVQTYSFTAYIDLKLRAAPEFHLGFQTHKKSILQGSDEPPDNRYMP